MQTHELSRRKLVALRIYIYSRQKLELPHYPDYGRNFARLNVIESLLIISESWIIDRICIIRPFHCFGVTGFNINYEGYCLSFANSSYAFGIALLLKLAGGFSIFWYLPAASTSKKKSREHRAYLGRLKNLYFYICNFAHARVARLPLHFWCSNNKHSNN